jgi:S1-C subfamily serine protease
MGVETNYDEAIKWFRLSAEQGNVFAQLQLASFYLLGNRVPKDYAEAFKWTYKAADQGNVDAQYGVGLFYLIGSGVSKDNIEAYKWFNLSSARGNQLAKTRLEELEQQMTMEQISEAQTLSREYKPGQPSETKSSSSKVSQQEPQLYGFATGFFITDDGYLISNYHVVKDATKVRLLTGAGLIDAKVVQVDAANDLALLKADGRFASLPIAASRTGLLGGTVATVGFPDIGLQGFAPKLAKGEIASLSGAGDDPRYFQISVPVQPGNSGGALVDERGNVIGIVSAKLDASAALAASGALPENVNYAVKSSLLLSFLESVPAVSAKLKAPITTDRKFEDVVKSAQDAAVLVLVY